MGGAARGMPAEREGRVGHKTVTLLRRACQMPADGRKWGKGKGLWVGPHDARTHSGGGGGARHGLAWGRGTAGWHAVPMGGSILY